MAHIIMNNGTVAIGDNMTDLAAFNLVGGGKSLDNIDQEKTAQKGKIVKADGMK